MPHKLRMKRSSIWSLFALALALVPLRTEAQPLVWDNPAKELNAAPGANSVTFTFSVTNVSDQAVAINHVRTSCGCTVPKLPTLPWNLEPGSHGSFDVDVDIRGKQGSLTKSVTVESAAGARVLTVRVNIPAGVENNRARNIMTALADRNAIFKNNCAACHVEPAIGKHGKELFQTACGICHEAEHRASMVPDLKAIERTFDHEYWNQWVRHGKPGTLMPGFSKTSGGFLDEKQIESLIEFLLKDYPVKPIVSTAGPTLAPPPLPLP
jgi:cytochrome c2